MRRWLPPVIAGVIGLLCVPSALRAESGFSLTLTFTTDYIFDGVSQTRGRPAFQVGAEYGFSDGFYVGAWGSNVDFGEDDPARAEVDLYGGYWLEVSDDLEIDLGAVYYAFPGAPRRGYRYAEVFAGLVFREDTTWYLWLADDRHVFDGFAWRSKLTHQVGLPLDFRLGLEAGYTRYQALSEGFLHYRVGVSRAWHGFDLDLSWHDTDLEHNPDARGTLVFTLSRTFEF